MVMVVIKMVEEKGELVARMGIKREDGYIYFVSTSGDIRRSLIKRRTKKSDYLDDLYADSNKNEV